MFALWTGQYFPLGGDSPFRGHVKNFFVSVHHPFFPQGEGVAYRGRLLMAVQAEFGESASEAGIRQVEVEGTAPISDVRSLLS